MTKAEKKTVKKPALKVVKTPESKPAKPEKPEKGKGVKKPAKVVTKEMPSLPNGQRPFGPAVDAACKELGEKLAEEMPERSASLLDAAERTDPLAKYEALSEVVQACVAANPSEVLECDHCGAQSTDHTEFCPFCGEGLPAFEEERAKLEGSASAEGASTSAIVPASDAAIDVAKSDLLTSAETEIRKLEGDIKTNAYRLGCVIRTVHEGELWKARGFTSFADWVEKETSIGRGYAYDLMQATKTFSEETFIKVGPGKLMPLVAVKDQAARDELVNEAGAGASAKVIREKAKIVKGKAPAKEKPARATPAKETGITLLAKVNGKATMYPWRGAESGRALKSHGEGSYAEIEISRDVRQRIALRQDKDGTIVGIEVSFVRVEK